MKKGKVTGPDPISVEELETLSESIVKVITKLINNDICNTGYIKNYENPSSKLCQRNQRP